MFKMFRVIGILTIEFFNFTDIGNVKQQQQKKHLKPSTLVIQSLFKEFLKKLNILLVFH